MVRRVEKRTLVTNLLVGGLGRSVLALFQIAICLEIDTHTHEIPTVSLKYRLTKWLRVLAMLGSSGPSSV